VGVGLCLFTTFHNFAVDASLMPPVASAKVLKDTR
jgi:hypothetical protein